MSRGTCLSVVLGLVLVSGALTASATAPSHAVFLRDDPLQREPETQDASGAREWTIDLIINLAVNLFGRPGDPTDVKAGDVNSIDEVPDSNWFTNRILSRPVSIDEAVRGPLLGPGPAAGPLTVIAARDIGMAQGFTAKDSAGETWFISFDARGYPEAATGAIIVANKIFWTLGYWQAENVLVRIRPEQLSIDGGATFRPLSGNVRALRMEDLDAVWERAHRSSDGSFRAVASRRLHGRPLGGFRYYGTRPDDPNDLVPHEHRRSLRALNVFGAWTNLVDMKAGNTLDVLITEHGRGVVRHYLQDVGSTFGTGANGPREFDEGWEHLYEGDLVWKRLASLGFLIRPWQTVRYDERPAVGRFEGFAFDPLTWKPRVPTAAFHHAQPDDLFWAARRVMAFSNELIAALVKSGEYSDPDAERHLAEVLMQRRDKIGTAYLIAVNPLVNFALSADGHLSFDNAAVMAGVTRAPHSRYRVRWALFDNTTASTTALGESVTDGHDGADAPQSLPAIAGAFVSVQVSVIEPRVESWTPIRATFRRTGNGWTLVGLERGNA